MKILETFYLELLFKKDAHTCVFRLDFIIFKMDASQESKVTIYVLNNFTQG